jgi:uncharacterized membrane protein
MSARVYNGMALVGLFGLIAFGLAWELWLAPLRPGGSTLALKVLPLLLPVFGLLRGHRYTHQWTSLLVLLYLTEALVRVGAGETAERTCAAISLVFALLLFIGCVGYARRTRPSLTPAD